MKGEEKTGVSEVGTRNDRSQGTAESLCHNRADTRCATGNDEHSIISQSKDLLPVVRHCVMVELRGNIDDSAHRVVGESTNTFTESDDARG